MAALGRRAQGLQEHGAARVARREEFRRVALKRVLERALDPLQPLLIEVGEADDVHPQLALRIETFRLRLEVDRAALVHELGVELGDGARGRGIEASLQPNERLVRAQERPELGLGPTEERRQKPRRAVGVLSQARRMSVQRLRRDADRELATLAVDDGPASAPDLDHLPVLAPRLGPERIGIDDLQLDESYGQRQRRKSDAHGHDDDAGSDRALIHGGWDPHHARTASTPISATGAWGNLPRTARAERDLPGRQRSCSRLWGARASAGSRRASRPPGAIPSGPFRW